MKKLKMDILYCEQLQVGRQGTESVHISEVATNLSRLGHNVVFLNTDFTRKETKIDVSRRSSWTRIKNSIIQSQIARPFRGEISIVWLFFREIPIFLSVLIIILKHRGKFDIIYRRHGLLNSEYLLSKVTKIPFVKEVNGIVVDERKKLKWGDRFSSWVDDRLERFNMPHADRVIVVTEKLKELLQSEYGVKSDKITVINNGANTDLFMPMDVTKARDELNLCQKRDYICFAGLLIEWQGLEYLLKSMPQILKQRPETIILIVGDGPMKQRLVELSKLVGVSNEVIFTGSVPYQRVPLYINASDVCVVPKVPAKSGYSPLKLCEYMACAKPVVASRLRGFEILEHFKAGILVESQNSTELATAIITLLQNQKLRRQMGKNGRRYVVQNQSWAIVAKRVADECQSLIASRNYGGES